MHKIKHIVEPEGLLLTWQDPASRQRFVVGELLREKTGICFRYLHGPDLEQAREHGFKGYFAFRDMRTEYRLGVMESFMTRLPPRSREDFGKFLEYWNIDPDAEISDFALLGYTGAALPRDGFRFLPVFPKNVEELTFIIEVAGHRYSGSPAAVGEAVCFRHENENRADPQAVAVLAGVSDRMRRIGYVMRGLNTQFIAWLETGEALGRIVRINGTRERPLVLVRVEFHRRTQYRMHS